MGRPSGDTTEVIPALADEPSDELPVVRATPDKGKRPKPVKAELVEDDTPPPGPSRPRKKKKQAGSETWDV